MHISTRHPTLAVRIGLDDAGVGREPFAAHPPFHHATLQDLFEHEPQSVVVPESAVPVLRERRMVGDRIFRAQLENQR